MNRNNIRYLVGNENYKVKVLPVYSDIVCSFLDDLSKAVRTDAEAKLYPDVQTFAYWCRKANITRMKEKRTDCNIRLGRGMAFHIAPSNVPVNFAFSLAFGMLSGNGNIVRVSEKEFPQTDIICRIMREVLEKPEYTLLKQQTQVVSYGHIREINDELSAKCSVRIIWGGDATIEEIRKSKTNPRCTDITFADRYSFAIFNEEHIDKITEQELNKLAEGFYNDTYLMDQNACSSTHLVLWTDSNGVGRKKFWKALKTAAERYTLPDKKAIDKYTLLCEKIVQIKEIQSAERYSNLLYTVDIDKLPERPEELRGVFGMFYQYDMTGMDELCQHISDRVQTCVAFGEDKNRLLKIFIENGALGIDRIVTPGEAMNIGVYWDGYDVIGNMSRMIVAE